MQPQPAAAPALAALSDGLVRNVEGTIIDAGPVREELEQNVDETQITVHDAAARCADRKCRSSVGR